MHWLESQTDLSSQLSNVVTSEQLPSVEMLEWLLNRCILYFCSILTDPHILIFIRCTVIETPIINIIFIKFILDITYFELAPAHWLILNILLSQVVRGGRGAAENHVLNQCNVIRQLFHINNLILIFDKYFTSMNQ